MGLPIWYPPSSSSSNDESKSAGAARARSSIRRHPQRSPPLRRAAALARIGEYHSTNAPPNAVSASLMDTDSTERYRRRRMDQAMRWDAVARIEDRTFLPPVPESRNFLSRRSRSPFHPPHIRDSADRSRPRRTFLPESEIEAAYIRDHGVSESLLTRAFAPARGERRRLSLSPDSEDRPEVPMVASALTGDNMSTRIRAVGNAGGASMSALRGNDNGLGDRLRSITPDLDWDPMLSTIQPDQQLPSADSSFATAAASASFSNTQPTSRSGSTNSASSSSRTNLTVPTPRREMEDPLYDCVSIDDTSDSDTLDERRRAGYTPRAAARTRATRRLGRQRPSTTRLQPRSEASSYEGDDTDRPSRRLGHGRLSGWDLSPEDGTQAPRADTSGHQDAETAASAHLRDPELEQMRPILERLARRGDISDDYWLSVGLTPVMAQTISRHGNRRLEHEYDSYGI